MREPECPGVQPGIQACPIPGRHVRRQPYHQLGGLIGASPDAIPENASFKEAKAD